MRSISSLGTVWFLWAAAIAAADDTRPDTARWEELKKAAASCPAPKAVQASFMQTRTSDLLADPVVTHGVFAASGTRAKWTTTDDKGEIQSVMALDLSAKTLVLYFPAQKTAECYPLGDRFAGFGALGAAPDFDQLMGFFSLEAFKSDAETLQMEMVPRAEDMRAHVARIMVVVDRKSGVARSMTTVDGAGDSTELKLTDARTPEQIAEADVVLTLPAGTRVDHPAGKPAGEPAH